MALTPEVRAGLKQMFRGTLNNHLHNKHISLMTLPMQRKTTLRRSEHQWRKISGGGIRPLRVIILSLLSEAVADPSL